MRAHKFNVPVAAHNVTLADAKALLRGGIEGWLHVPVRGSDEVDAEIIQIVKDRIAKNDRPNLWMTPALAEPFMCSRRQYTSGLAGRSAFARHLFL